MLIPSILLFSRPVNDGHIFAIFWLFFFFFFKSGSKFSFQRFFIASLHKTFENGLIRGKYLRDDTCDSSYCLNVIQMPLVAEISLILYLVVIIQCQWQESGNAFSPPFLMRVLLHRITNRNIWKIDNFEKWTVSSFLHVEEVWVNDEAQRPLAEAMFSWIQFILNQRLSRSAIRLLSHWLIPLT